jgi:hypothetical protein
MANVNRLYANEKLSAAVDALASAPGRIHERLDAAFRNLALVDSGSLPEQARPIWEAAWKRLTVKPADGQRSACHNSLTDADEDEVQEVVRKILTVHAMVDHLKHED